MPINLSIDKNRFLAMPRVLAALLRMPALGVLSDLVALLGGFVLTNIKFYFSANIFFNSVTSFFSTYDVFVGLFKSFVFGGVTALIGVHVGFSTTGGAEGVGKSTVRSFTLSAASILILDAVFGYLL